MPFLLSAEAIEILAAILGALATALGGAAGSGLFEKLWQIFQRKHLATDTTLTVLADGNTPVPGKTRAEIAKAQAIHRIDGARTAMLRQVRRAKWGKFSSNSLTFGQYVIGAVMASAFVQKSLSPNIVGIFGIVVLIASAMKQHYHPDANVQNALQSASQLETLISQSEDRLVVIQTTAASNTDDPMPYLELMERITAETGRIVAPSIATPTKAIVKRSK
jgi:hypothetical protein